MIQTVSPIIVATWKFGLPACELGFHQLEAGESSLIAVEAGANLVEADPRVNSVGYGGLPNALGEVELDAAIMDGPTHSAGAVGGLTRVKHPISVARKVMENTPHVFLVGENARLFAENSGFLMEDLLTTDSRERWLRWQKDQSASEVAHFDVRLPEGRSSDHRYVPTNHDTIGLCALDRYGDLAVGCTTSGIAWKTPGRVGDTPIIGSGLYVDNAVGAAAATGHGDEIMKSCLSYRTVILMEQGLSAQEACEEAIRYLLKKRDPDLYNQYGAAVIALRKDGDIGAAASLSGFRSPDQLWQWAYASRQHPAGRLSEGSYVTISGKCVSLTPAPGTL